MGELSQLARQLVPFMDFQFYAPRCLKIRAKNGRVIPFKMNRAQLYLHSRIEQQLKDTGKVRVIGLKGRQQGFSTYVEARFYHRTSMRYGKRAAVMTHLQDSTDALFEMVKRYHENCPAPLQPATKAASAKELLFSTYDSGYNVATAGSTGVGRGRTIQYMHACLAADTLVIDGDTGNLIRMGEAVVGQAIRTHAGKVARISFISHQEKEAFHITLRSVTAFPLVATAEHRLWTSKGWAQAGELRVGEEVGFPVATIAEQHVQVPFRLADAHRPQGGGTKETGPDEVLLDYNVGRILGLYLAEGTVKRQAKTGEPCGVHFSVHEDEAERTVAWLNAVQPLFRSVSSYTMKGSKTVIVTAYGKSFATFVDRMCGNKHFPVGWHQAGAGYARGLIHGYLCGDGHFSPHGSRRIAATSIRSSLTVGARDILASLGYGWAAIAHKSAAIRHGRDEKEAFTLSLCGPGVERLAEEVGKPYVKRKRGGEGGNRAARIAGGYAWLKISSIGAAESTEVVDFEVDHDDHSYCTLQCATHNSELAFWKNAEDHFAGIGQTVPNERDTEIIVESTANGVGNLFHGLWQDAERGRSDYIPIFVPWFWQEEYSLPCPEGFVLDAEEADYAERYGLTNGQAFWRRMKIRDDFRGDESLFDQEYPATPSLAFQRVAGNPYIAAGLVEKARNTRGEKPVGAKIMGVDVAEYGDDDSSICVRQGRVVQPLEVYHGKGPMELVGLVGIAADKIDPDIINVDCTGIGSGVADRLIELGYPVQRVHFGSRAIREQDFKDRRAEMYGELREWLENAPCMLPDDDVLAGEISSPQYTYDSSRRLVLESKEKMKERGIKSPDRADSLALTFAVKVLPRKTDDEKRRARKSSWRC